MANASYACFLLIEVSLLLLPVALVALSGMCALRGRMRMVDTIRYVEQACPSHVFPLFHGQHGEFAGGLRLACF